jgi:hypothetical protein
MPADTGPADLPLTLRIGSGPTVGRLGFGAMRISNPLFHLPQDRWPSMSVRSPASPLPLHVSSSG